MASPLPDDPYLALGVAKDAPAAAIKTAYRKLVLKCHPDKVTDETLKKTAADNFHKIQTAWETIGDEDKRSRYDAQCKLAALRKEAMERQVASEPVRSEVRTAAYRMPTEPRPGAVFTARGPERASSFHVEERKPHEPSYFDGPRTAERREYDYDYERPQRRTPPKDDRPRVRILRQDPKETERARHREKGRQSTKDTARNRDYKYSHPQPDTASDSDSDSPNERVRQKRREEEQMLRAREQYYEQSRRQKEEAASGRYGDERARKMFDAMNYIERSRVNRQHSDTERRPSPSRSASKDKVEFVRRDGRPAAVRHGSGRPRTAVREDSEPPRRSRRDPERERPSSNDFDELPRKPPPLNQTKSAPDNIRIPGEKPRAYSVQVESDFADDFRPTPIRRADTMPQQLPRREEARKSQKPSSLRQTETSDDVKQRRSPTDPSSSQPSRYQYGKEYADDHEYATPNGYRTEVREPNATGRKVTRSPSPMRDHDRMRSASARHPTQSSQVPPPPPPPLRTTSTSYMYTPQGVEKLSPRIHLSRNDSSRKDPYLYGEIPVNRSPRQNGAPFSASPDGVKCTEIKPEDVKVQAGYSTSRRPSNTRTPTYIRTNSFNSPVPA